MAEEHYLELSENPVQFEHASSVNNVFFDEANKQVFAVRSGGATGVVVKGPDDKSSVAFRMDDKGEVKCIKFSIGNKILAVQRTSKSVDFINFIPDYPHTEFSQECKTKNANILGFCWTNWNEVVFITDQGIEFYQVFPDKRSLKLLKSQSINVNWYQYCPETAVILLSTTVQGNILQPFAFRNGTMSKMSKFEIELPVVPKPAKLSLSERDIAMATIYGQLYVMYLKHHSRTANSPSAEVVLYHLSREGSCKKSHVLKLNTTGKFALNIVDNLVVVHHQSSQTSLIFDIKLKEPDCALNIHQPVLPARSIHPYRIPLSGPAAVPSQPPVPCQLYSSSWSVFQPDIIISASEGYLWYLQVKLPPTVNLLQDKGKLMDFLLRRRECKMVILSVCSQILEVGEKGSLPVVATVFDKLNQVYKDYLEAEQSYTQAMESGPSRGSAAQKRPVRTQAVVDQSDMYTHVLSSFTERKGVSHKFIIAVLMEYIRSLNQFQVTVQHYLYELVIKTLVQHNLFYMLHQFLQYHVLSDSKPLVSSNQELVLQRRVCRSVAAPHLPLSRAPRRAGCVHRFSVSLLNCVLSGVFAAVSGEHVPPRAPAVPGHAEASVHGQRRDHRGSAVEAAGSGRAQIHPQRRWPRQRVCAEVPGRGAADRRPDAVLHGVQVVPAEKPATQGKPRLQPRRALRGARGSLQAAVWGAGVDEALHRVRRSPRRGDDPTSCCRKP